MTYNVFYYHDFFYLLKIIRIELINKYYNNLPVNYFDIKKKQEIFA